MRGPHGKLLAIGEWVTANFKSCIIKLILITLFVPCVKMELRMNIIHKGLNRFHRGHTAYIHVPYILTRDATTNVAKPLPVLFQT